MTNLNDMDMMAEAGKKQDSLNEGPSMQELFAKKRAEAEKALLEKTQSGKPSNQEVEDRKARLLAQRDMLKKQKEEKR